jgi:hypothetical protein
MSSALGMSIESLNYTARPNVRSRDKARETALW